MYGGQDRILKHTTLYSKGFETRPQLAGAMGESAMHALPHTLTTALKRLSSTCTCYSRVVKAPDFPHRDTNFEMASCDAKIASASDVCTSFYRLSVWPEAD